MSYGNYKWTCGRCGDSFEASGAVGDLKVARWTDEHKEQHRVEDMPEAKRREYMDRKLEAMFAHIGSRTPHSAPSTGASPEQKGSES